MFMLFPAPDFTHADPHAHEANEWAARMEAEFAAMRDAQRPVMPQPERPH